jgi:hypothetical protein
MASMVVAAGAAGWVAAVLDDGLIDDGPRTMTIEQPPAQAQPVPTAAVHNIERAGQVTAVSAESLTTRGADGQVTTFTITPDTTHVSHPGAAVPFAAGAVAPAQNVVVVGQIEHGVPVATVIADPAAASPSGPPMDYQLPT